MKRILLLFLVVLGFQRGIAQSQLTISYEPDSTMVVGGMTYNIVNKIYQFEIIRSDYVLYDQEMKDIEGNEIMPGDYYGAAVVEDSFWQAFTETFTEEEIAGMRDAETPTIIYIFVTKDNTAKPLEVVLTIWKTPGAMAIPIEKWALYEQNIKTYFRWHGMTEDEKRTPFSHHFYQLDKRDLVRRFAVLPDVEPIHPM